MVFVRKICFINDLVSCQRKLRSFKTYTSCAEIQARPRSSDENFPEKFKSENFPFFIRIVDMVSLFTFYTVIIMLIYTSPFILIGR
jgi:hypothetical protein